MINLLLQTFAGIFTPPLRIKEFVQQLYFFANQSLPVVLFCVSFAAIVTILESSFHMKIVIQNDSMVPGFAALLILRELGAVVTALLLTSRVGAGYASEIGIMQVTEQVDALKMLGINPVQYLVVPRFLAGIVGGVLLTVVANIACLAVAVLVSTHYLDYTPNMFLTAMNRFVSFQDFIFAMIKGAFFGGVIPLVAAYFGFSCKAGAEGVGRATTNTVVVASVAVIVIDFILSYTFSYFY
ncbi:MAG: MlaE family ABC transporter permease [Bdellovibrionia bacterium]